MPLQGRALEILVFLVANRDRAVGCDEILKAVYEGMTVEPTNVAVQVSAVRKAIARAGGDAQVIQTLRGGRYQFIGELAASPPPPLAGEPPEALAAAPLAGDAAIVPKRRYVAWVGAACIAILLAGLGARVWLAPVAAPPARLSIVVMPFRNLSFDRDQDPLADAISDDLSSDLAHIPASTVIARESADSFKGKSATVQQIGAELRVRYVVEGSLRVEDGQFHITAQLVDAVSGVVLWSERFDVHAEKMGDVRDQIVRRIYSALNLQFDLLESARSMHDRPDDPNVLDLFFRARSRLDWDHSLAGFEFAQERLETAVEQQSDFADAQAELGWMLLRKVSTIVDPDEAADFSEAKAAIAKALTLSPQNTLALAARARAHQIEGDCAAARPDAEQALAAEPSSLQAHTVMASCALAEDRLDDAAEHYETILHLNPVSPNNGPRYGALGVIRLIQGRYGEAIDLLQKARRDEDPSGAAMSPSEESRVMLIAATELHGDHSEAQDLQTKYAHDYPGRTVWRISTYLRRSWLKLDGVRRLLSALQSAGMSPFADENTPGLPDGAPCKGSDFALTPRALPGGEVVFTTGVAKYLAGGQPPVIIDVGSGTFPIAGSHVYNATAGKSANAFAAEIAGLHAQPQTTRIVVLGDGPTGCTSFDAAAYLVGQGYSKVMWYRGGEESWYRSQSKPEITGFSTGK